MERTQGFREGRSEVEMERKSRRREEGLREGGDEGRQKTERCESLSMCLWLCVSVCVSLSAWLCLCVSVCVSLFVCLCLCVSVCVSLNLCVSDLDYTRVGLTTSPLPKGQVCHWLILSTRGRDE